MPTFVGAIGTTIPTNMREIKTSGQYIVLDDPTAADPDWRPNNSIEITSEVVSRPARDGF